MVVALLGSSEVRLEKQDSFVCVAQRQSSVSPQFDCNY